MKVFMIGRDEEVGPSKNPWEDKFMKMKLMMHAAAGAMMA
ncbi:MAG: hypothetical protein ACJAXK_002233, partial [Yoonia sp.]